MGCVQREDCLRLWVKGRSVGPRGAAARNMTASSDGSACRNDQCEQSVSMHRTRHRLSLRVEIVKDGNVGRISMIELCERSSFRQPYPKLGACPFLVGARLPCASWRACQTFSGGWRRQQFDEGPNVLSAADFLLPQNLRQGHHLPSSQGSSRPRLRTLREPPTSRPILRSRATFVLMVKDSFKILY